MRKLRKQLFLAMRNLCHETEEIQKQNSESPVLHIHYCQIQ